MNTNNYKTATTKIFYGVLGLSIFSVIGGFVSVAALAASIAGESAWYAFVVPILNVLCYVYYFIGLGDLYKEFSGPTYDNLKKVRTAAILSIVGTICTMIPVAGNIINGVLAIIAAILCIQAYGYLRNAGDFPGTAGAKTLYTATILQIIAAILCIIPLIGIVGAIMNIIVFVMIIVGWAKVKNAPINQAIEQ
ncbi:MAG: hypothetical protein IK126_02715 [Bacteroidales bacterium]|nr:hypothetical protein [Bacteroidales bacterium]